MTKMPLEVNSVDWAEYCAVYGYTEIPRKVEGPNGGTAINGDTIWDIVACKYDLIVPLMPLTMSQLKTVMASCAGGAVPVRYMSIETDNYVTRMMKPDLSSVALALKSPIQEYFSGMTVTFTEA